jgi:peptidoglycan/xylan/chitin deacetylase (PgdA/CDA1 family)
VVRAAGRLIGDAADAAREEVALYRREPERLPELELGSFEERPVREAARLRIALSAAVPPRVLARLAGREGESFVRAFAFWHAVRRAAGDDDLWRRLTHGTTVLMYHAFASAEERASRYVLPVAAFERQLRWLRLRRPLLDLAELAAHRRDGRLPPANAVAITIDDGYADLGSVGPMLRRHGVPATVFVVTAKAGGVNDWDRDGEVAGRALLSWKELGYLARDGVSIGAHTRTHPQLTLQSREQATAEIAGSRADVEARLGAAPESFAYPYGRVNDAVEALASDAGFALALGIERCRNGPATPTHRLRRVEIDGRLSFLRFVRTLAQ